MTPSAAITPSARAKRAVPRRPGSRQRAAARERAVARERARHMPSRTRHHGAGARADTLLASYLDCDGRRREVVSCEGANGSVLVIDRDCATLGDRRLIAHLASDEPAGNAEIVCSIYMHLPTPSSCRRVRPEDLKLVPGGELEELAAQPLPETQMLEAQTLQGPGGERFVLETLDSGMTIPELRWRRRTAADAEAKQVSLREVVGSLESYEPARTLTARALLAHREDLCISVTALQAELQRLNTSRTVLNRGLREAVLRRVKRDGLTMSEVALRCDRVKHDPRGGVSGETTWLARRLGLVAEAPGCAPSPWVHSDVLALVARSGLGVSPREVELA